MQIYFNHLDLKNAIDFQITIHDDYNYEIDNILEDLSVIHEKYIPITKSKVPLTKEAYYYIEDQLTSLLLNWVNEWLSEERFNYLSKEESEEEIIAYVQKQFIQPNKALKNIQSTANGMIEHSIKTKAINALTSHLESVHPEIKDNRHAIDPICYTFSVYYLIEKQDVHVNLSQVFPKLEDTTLQKEDAFYCGVVFMKFPDDIDI